VITVFDDIESVNASSVNDARTGLVQWTPQSCGGVNVTTVSVEVIESIFRFDVGISERYPYKTEYEEIKICFVLAVGSPNVFESSYPSVERVTHPPAV